MPGLNVSSAQHGSACKPKPTAGSNEPSSDHQPPTDESYPWNDDTHRNIIEGYDCQDHIGCSMGMGMHGLGMGCNVPTHTNPWGFCGFSHRFPRVGSPWTVYVLELRHCPCCSLCHVATLHDQWSLCHITITMPFDINVDSIHHHCTMYTVCCASTPSPRNMSARPSPSSPWHLSGHC